MKLQTNDFIKRFPDDRSCFAFLVQKKWNDGFTCRKCNHALFSIGRKWHHRRCKKCRYEESATAHTLFHKIKFPLLKAFQIIHLLSTSNTGLSTVEIANSFDIKQSTAWFFKRKVQQAFYNVETSFLTEQSKLATSDSLVRLRTLLPARLNRVTKVNFETRIHAGHNSTEIHKALISSIHMKGRLRARVVEKHRKACGMRWLINLQMGRRNDERLCEKYRSQMVDWIKSTHQHISAKHMFYYCCEFNFRLNQQQLQDCWSTFFRVMDSMVRLPWFSYRLLAKFPVQN
jgi:hypothetical protein